MESQTICCSSIQEQLYKILRQEIVTCALREGEQLKEQELASRFNISRSPVREVLYRLVGDGLVTLIPNRGAYVKKFDVKYMLDVLDLREMLELRAIEIAPLTMSPEAVARFEALRKEMVKLLASGEADVHKHADLDIRFHGQIMNLNDNAFIKDVSEKIAAMNSMCLYISLQMGSRAVQSQQEHIETIDALLDGDVDRAAEIYKTHLSRTKQRVMNEFAHRSLHAIS
ncbi:MAG: GntR family transcriptional regulator [Candidatus Heteroscillospira sp.]